MFDRFTIQSVDALRKNVFLIGVFCCLGCDLPGQPNPDEMPIPHEKVLSFSVIFGTHCAGCHGENGEFGPAPPLNDPIFRTIVGEKNLLDVLSNGRSHTSMPIFSRSNGGPLTNAQIQVLIYEIKGIKYRLKPVTDRTGEKSDVSPDENGIEPAWGIPKTDLKNIPPYSADLPPATKQLVDRGQKVYANACSQCHGDNGKGSDLAGAINNRSFLALMSNQALRRIIITGRPDLEMPNYASNYCRPLDYQPLNSSDINNLVLYIRSWRANQ